MKNFSKSDYLKFEYDKINNLFLSGKFDVVIEKSKKILKKNPNQISFYNFLALSYREKGEMFLAEKILLNALKIRPNSQSVLTNLGSTYRVLIEYDKSEKFLKEVLSINPNNINALVNYANLKRDTNNYDESIQLYEKAYKINNKIPTILINLAGAYQIVGKFDLAETYLEKLLKEDNNNTLAHKILSTIKKYEKNDPHQAQMNSILKKNDLKEIDKANLLFAISKSYEDQEDYKNSFVSFKKANDIQKKIHKNYSINEEAKLFKIIKATFKETDFKSYTQFTNNKKLIFIVGLPRSGTTLSHQILAAHSKVHGAGEIVILDQWMIKKINNQNFTSLFKDHSINNDAKIKAIINSYFSKISYIKTNKNIILDKNPLNFQWLGFIKILFPNAKIIHCTRNLKDTALSIYKNAFDINSIVWSNNQEDLVEYISLYLDLMKFWEKKIPNFIYNLNYEKLINNQKEQTEKLLNFCELNWEEDCLNYNKKATAIKTVSATQARKPIYKTSLNLYEKYYNYLDMFKKIEELEKA
jgi:Tfp pilus assembly protein PilF